MVERGSGCLAHLRAGDRAKRAGFPAVADRRQQRRGDAVLRPGGARQPALAIARGGYRPVRIGDAQRLPRVVVAVAVGDGQQARISRTDEGLAE